MKEGYLYAAHGLDYVREAIQSVKSLKKVNPHCHATLLTDREVDCPFFDDVRILEIDELIGERNEFGYLKDGFTFKILSILHSPYEHTFYVDTDVYFTDSCDECFSLLKYYDLLISKDTSDHTPIIAAGECLTGYYSYNTGILVFRRSEYVQTLFKEWLTIWNNSYSIYPQDQPALMEAMLHHAIRLYCLPVNYNFRLQFFVSVKGKVKVLHGRHGDMDRVSKRINDYTGQRMWDYQRQRLIHNDQPRDWKGKVISLLPVTLYQKYLNLKSYLRNWF